ncbi:MAG: hypothetical protein KatS3mg102_0780 [Planctomycetota bacterium]|nr:MAG: hypothetical protein KatS3mg102_0780 [Planctomycetota bacterium]
MSVRRLRIAFAGFLVLVLVVMGLMVAQVSDDHEVDRIGARLRRPPSSLRFEPTMLAGVPEPARRWLLHAIEPGTLLANSVELELRGARRPEPTSGWRSFHAGQVLAPPAGFVWRANLRQGALVWRVAEHYEAGAARVRHALFGLIPAGSDRTEVVERSLRARLVLEAVLVPAALLPAAAVPAGEGDSQAGADPQRAAAAQGPAPLAWQALDERRARVRLRVDGQEIPLTIEVAPDGRLLAAWVPRPLPAPLATPETPAGTEVPFGWHIEAEARFDGYTIPARARGGWWFGSEQYTETLRLELVRARFAAPAPAP